MLGLSIGKVIIGGRPLALLCSIKPPVIGFCDSFIRSVLYFPSSFKKNLEYFEAEASIDYSYYF